MKNPHLPIYDSQVAAFYFFQFPSTNINVDKRIDRLEAFHNFLINEYARIIKDGLLKLAIQVFNKRFNQWHLTEEKIIDSLIWQYVNILDKGALPKKEIFYS